MGDTLLQTRISKDTRLLSDFPIAHTAAITLPAGSNIGALPGMTSPTALKTQMSNPRPRMNHGPESSRVPSSSSPIDMIGTHPTHSVALLRKLPQDIGSKGVRNLLVFAKDLINVRLVDSTAEDIGYATALAQFTSHAGAREVKDMLHGKMNVSQDAKIIVEIPSAASPTEHSTFMGSRRSTLDGTIGRSAPVGSAGSSEQSSRQSSRFSSAFQSSERISPLMANSGLTSPAEHGAFQSMFPPQSPGRERKQHNFGKAVINDDAVDDETDGLLRDPLAYAQSGRPINDGRVQMPPMPTSQFSSMSLGNNGDDDSNHRSNGNSGLISPATGLSYQNFTPRADQQNTYGPPSSGPGRTSYPPANPADQNPPCNTLYVGNLPNNTSEDELKRLFCQQRGYKRLCFRTKQNGPMCFVEFESITLATQALHHLYGKMLSNSVKGGIRLSFSKNPLGVRSGQAGMMPNGMHSYGGFGGFGNDITPPPGFPTGPSGPPPGLASGGRNGSGYGRPPMQDGANPAYQAHQYSMSGAPFASQLRMPMNGYAQSPGPGMYPPGY